MNNAVVAEGLSKRYRIGLKEKVPDTLAGTVAAWIKSPLSNYRDVRNLNRFDHEKDSKDVIWALRDVSFDVGYGEVVGIIGRNGAGKSTLLKIISRITKPTKGKAILNGRVASLLEVGTGFHMDLTGRENIYLNATLLGMSKTEVNRKFDEIVAFSGIEKFIDTPFKRYSSGMKIRLGFSVAAHLEAEIMLVDEVLAVGDLSFQKKCIGRMQEIASEGRTVLFVSHELAAVERLCDRCFLMEEGRITLSGETRSIISAYVGLEEKAILEWIRRDPAPDHAYIRRVVLIDPSGKPISRVYTSSQFGVEVECVVPNSTPDQKVGVAVRDSHENPIFFTLPTDESVPNPNSRGIYRYRVLFPEAFFMPRRYIITAAVWLGRVWSDSIRRAIAFDVEPDASLATSEGSNRPGIIQVQCKWEYSSTELTAEND